MLKARPDDGLVSPSLCEEVERRRTVSSMRFLGQSMSLQRYNRHQFRLDGSAGKPRFAAESRDALYSNPSPCRTAPLGQTCSCRTLIMPTQPLSRGTVLTAASGLAVLVIACYLPSLWCGFIYDDFKMVHSRPALESVDDAVSVFTTRQTDNLPYYRPLTWLSLDLQSLVHGRSALLFHAANLLLVSGWACGLLWLFSVPLFRLSWRGALMATGLAAVHPVTACVVYPISSGRETLLPALCMTVAMGAWLRPGRNQRKIAWGFFLAGLLCREQVVVLPGLFLLADLCLPVQDRPESVGSWIRRYAPGGVLLLTYFGVRWLLFGGSGEHELAIWTRPLAPLLSIGYTLQTIVAPVVDLVFEPGDPVTSVAFFQVRMVVAVGIVAVLGLLAWRKPMTREVLVFWSGWSLLVVSPTANFVRQQTPFAERYGFLAMVAIVAILVTVLEQYQQQRIWKRAGIGLVMALAVTWSLVGWARGESYRSNRTFLEQWVRSDPDSAQAHLSLAGLFRDEQQEALAEQHLDRALALQPGYAEAHDGKGLLLFHRGELAAAESHFRRAVKNRPRFAEYWNRWGYVLAVRGRLDEAAEKCRRALELDGGLVAAYNNLGMVLARQGHYVEAEQHLRRAVSLNPDNAEAWNNLGQVREEQGDQEQAREYFRRAAQLNPEQETSYGRQPVNDGKAVAGGTLSR